jgi:hypothetical protein
MENDTVGGFTPATGSFFKNILLYAPSGGTAVVDTGTGNQTSNNTSTATNNPGFTNPSTTFLVISDFTPTNSSAYGGATSLTNNLTDCIGTLWAPTWDRGACHH